MSHNDIPTSRILCAAPGLVNTGLIKALANDPHYHVVTAETPKEALKMATSTHPDLVLVDDRKDWVSLPDLITKVKGRNADIPILMFRDGKDNLREEAIWTTGIDDCMFYPVYSTELIHHVARALNVRRIGQTCEELRKENQQLYQLAITDGLTRLVNRRHFMERLEAEFARARRFKGRLGCVICDIDFFKKVNDTYGHGVGDRVLRQVSSILAATIRSIDIAGRYGGEEFVLLLPETALEGVVFVAEKVRSAIEEFDFTPDDPSEAPGPAHLTISLGVAGFPEAAVNSPDELLALADQALYRAKQGGRNRVESA